MSIFKPCDIRGTYPDELDEQAAEAIGRAVATALGVGRCILAGDVRLSTPPLKEAVCRGLVRSGATVVDIGIAPTPVAYWAKRQMGADGLVVVTASHNPPHHNGMKLMMGGLPVTPEDLEAVRRRVERAEFASACGSVQRQDVKQAYLDWLAARFAGTGQGRKVLVDAGNGTTSEWAPQAFRAAGYRVEELFCEPDGRFPNRSPNPCAAAALSLASERVRQVRADFAACFDGDGDRAVFLDEGGRFVRAEDALILFSRQALREEPGAAVVYDLKCTRMVPREIQSHGGRAVMERSGHSFIKRRLVGEQAILAGEASGHFFFRELQGDDGIYAALKMGQLLGEEGKALSKLLGTIAPYFISEDIRIPCQDPHGTVERLRDAFSDRPQDHADGVRVEFDGGWALCRASVTEQALTLRVEGDSPKRMEAIRALVLEQIGLQPAGEAISE
jgi:phosphomannomutase/phosphoglucomutase